MEDDGTAAEAVLEEEGVMEDSCSAANSQGARVEDIDPSGSSSSESTLDSICVVDKKPDYEKKME